MIQEDFKVFNRLGKAPCQVDEGLARQIFENGNNTGNEEERFIRILGWASFIDSRRFIQSL